MKYLLILLIVVVLLWLARRSLARPPAPPAPAPQPPKAIEDMVRCARCGLHLPRSQALPGIGGDYCGEPHRAEHERELRQP